MEKEETSVARLNAMANVLSAMKDTFFPDRSEKDEIVKRASEIILIELKNLNGN
jgi:hypothetical protein